MEIDIFGSEPTPARPLLPHERRRFSRHRCSNAGRFDVLVVRLLRIESLPFCLDKGRQGWDQKRSDHKLHRVPHQDWQRVQGDVGMMLVHGIDEWYAQCDCSGTHKDTMESDPW